MSMPLAAVMGTVCSPCVVWCPTLAGRHGWRCNRGVRRLRASCRPASPGPAAPARSAVRVAPPGGAAVKPLNQMDLLDFSGTPLYPSNPVGIIGSGQGPPHEEVVASDPNKETPLRRTPIHRSARVATAMALAAGTAGLATLISVTSSAQADPAFVSAYAGVGCGRDPGRLRRLHRRVAGPARANTHLLHAAALVECHQRQDDRVVRRQPGRRDDDRTPGCITTKLGGPSFDRPNSSTAGIAAAARRRERHGLGELLGVLHRRHRST